MHKGYGDTLYTFSIIVAGQVSWDFEMWFVLLVLLICFMVTLETVIEIYGVLLQYWNVLLCFSPSPPAFP